MIHHIEIYVSNLPKTIDFWSWFLSELGYNQYQRWDEGISWKDDHSYIVFVQAKEKYVEAGYHRSRIGLNHLAFYAKSKKHVDEVTDKLREKSIQVLYEDRHPYAGGAEHYAVFFEDPDRIKVELVAP